MPLRREQVVEAAVELLDEVGLDGFTTRALTDRLGVQRGALYWHVKSKDELLTAVTSKIIEPAFEESADDVDWAEGFAVFAARLRAAMLAHRDGARLVATYVTLDKQSLRTMEGFLARLRQFGVPHEMAARFGDTIASYVTGFVLQEQAQKDAGGETELDVEGLPNLTEWLANGHPDSQRVFTASVGTIILGMRAELAALGTTSALFRPLG